MVEIVRQDLVAELRYAFDLYLLAVVRPANYVGEFGVLVLGFDYGDHRECLGDKHALVRCAFYRFDLGPFDHWN